MWESYRKFTKSQWAGISASLAKIGIIRSVTGCTIYFCVWLAGSMLYLACGVIRLAFIGILLLLKTVFASAIAVVYCFLKVDRPLSSAFSKVFENIPALTGKMDGWDYEQFVANRLGKEGYRNVRVTSGSGDFGADIIAYDRKNRKCCIQCKLYKSPVGVKAVQEIIAAREYYDGDVAMVITSSTFTNAALELAQSTGVVLRSNYK